MSASSSTTIVIGAGIGGLLAAKALSAHCERVLILERDSLPNGPHTRAGVAQSAQPHILLLRGIQAFEQIVPGFREALIAAGAVVHGPRDWRLILSGGELASIDADITTLGATRALVEWMLRTHVLATPNIELRAGARVTGLDWSKMGDRVTGVRIAGQGIADDHVGGELVVDSSGRGSVAADWLQAKGTRPVREEVVTCNVGYSSCFFHRSPSDPSPSLLIQPRPPTCPGLGVLIAVEGNRWQLMLGGMAGHFPSLDPEELIVQAGRLASHDISHVIEQAEPCSRPRGFRIPATRLRRFEELTPWPTGLVVLGDAVASFNPIYGQGMTVAALEALALGQQFGEAVPGWEVAFQRVVSRIVAFPWTTGAGEDLRWPGVTLDGRPASRAQRMQYWYLDRVYAAATVDPVVSLATIETINLLHDSPPFLKPRMIARVLRSQPRRRATLDHNTAHPELTLGGRAAT